MRQFLNGLFKRRHYEHTGEGGGRYFDIARVLRRARTKWQKIEVVQTTHYGRAMLLDGITQLTETQEYQYHEPMAHLPLLAHPAPRRVLVIGGGDGALVREILRHASVESVDFVELDEGVIEFCRAYFPELGGEAFKDDRVRLHIQDGRAFVENQVKEGAHYDAIFMDMTDPSGPSLALYTLEFFRSVSHLLADDDAFFVMHTESPDLRPRLFAKIFASLRPAFPVLRCFISHVHMYGGQWSWAFCSKRNDPASIAPKEIATRIGDRQIQGLKIISPTTWPAFFALWPAIEALLAKDESPATDANRDYPA